jgi:hypothetical protein
MSVNNKKVLAEQLKTKLNSPDYVAMPDLISYDDRYGGILAFLWGSKIDGNIYKEGNLITCKNIKLGKNLGKENDSEYTVDYNELEKDDWGEIVKLIKKRNKERRRIYDQKESQIKEKLNNTPNLYYRFSNNKRIGTSHFRYPDKHGEYFGIKGIENGREYWLNININHPVLKTFSWEKNGYYLITTNKKIERNDEFGRPWSDHGEDNPNNFHKWVEIGDEITITPYEVSEKSIDYPKEDKNFSLLKEKPANKADKEVINWLIKYFQKNNIKEIAFKNNELVITNNKNEVVATSEQKENQIIKHYLQESSKQSLSKQELSNFLNTESIPTNPKNNMPLLIGGGIVVLVVGIVIGFLVRNRVKKSK